MKNTSVRERKQASVSAIFTQFCMVFVVALIASNIFETKEIATGPFCITGGLLIFPICYIISDCVCEIWGFRKSWALILAGFVLNFLFIGIAALVDALPGTDTWTNQEGFHAIFGFSARITLASCVAFLVGGYLNILVLDRMKKRSGENRLGLRLIVSSMAGEAADSLIFFPLALLGTVPLISILDMMLMQFILKVLYEVVFLPLTLHIIRRLKARLPA